MVLLYIGLPAYRQLTRLRKNLLAEIENAVEQFRVESGVEPILEREGAWYFQLSSFQNSRSRSTQRRKRAFGESLLKLRGELDRREKHLQGYSSLIDIVEPSEHQGIADIIMARLLLSASDGVFWISSSAAEIFKDLLSFGAPHGEFLSVEQLRPETNRVEPQPIEFLVREELLSELTAAVQQIHLRESNEPFIGLVVAEDDGCRETVRYMLEVLSANADARPWMITTDYGARLEHVDPLLDTIASVTTEIDLDKYLSPLEFEIWNSIFPVATGLTHNTGIVASTDCAETDLYQLMALLLAAYGRRMEELLLPPIWVCEMFENLPETTRSVCAAIIKNHRTETNIIPLVTTGDAKQITGLAEYPLAPLYAPRLDRREVDSKTQAFWAEQDGGPSIAEANSLHRYEGGSVLALYHAAQLLMAGGRDAAIGPDPTCALIDSFDRESKEIFLHRLYAGGVLDAKDIRDFLIFAGYDRESIQATDDSLKDIRLDAVDHGRGGLEKYLIEQLTIDYPELTRVVSDYLLERWQRNDLRVTKAVGEMVWRGSGKPQSVALLEELVSGLLETNRCEEAAKLLENLETAGAVEEAKAAMYALMLRVYVVCRLSRKAAGIYSIMKDLPRMADETLQGKRYLENARYLYAGGSYQSGLQEAKDALMVFQQNEPKLEADACFFVGIDMLAESKLGEAEAYFNIARESGAEPLVSRAVLTGIYSAITQYLIGNISRASKIAAGALATATSKGMHRYQVFLLFFEMRMQFELGQYERCVTLCLEALTLTELYDDRPRPVLNRWLRRAQAYAGQTDDAEVGLNPESTSNEELLFLAEVHFFNARYEKAISSLEKISTTAETGGIRFLPAEYVDWRTGFSMIEDKAITGSGESPALRMLTRSFRSYLHCLAGRPELGLSDLARVTREERLSEFDPSNGVYFYLYAYAIECQSGTGDLDRLTALSKALKFIQERAAAMDNAAERQLYLRHNYWNSRILEEAKSSKLL